MNETENLMKSNHSILNEIENLMKLNDSILNEFSLLRKHNNSILNEFNSLSNHNNSILNGNKSLTNNSHSVLNDFIFHKEQAQMPKKWAERCLSAAPRPSLRKSVCYFGSGSFTCQLFNAVLTVVSYNGNAQQ